MRDLRLSARTTNPSARRIAHRARLRGVRRLFARRPRLGSMSTIRSPFICPAFAKAAAPHANLRFFATPADTNARFRGTRLPIHLPCLSPSKSRTVLEHDTLCAVKLWNCGIMKFWKCEVEVDANSHFPLAVSTITQFHNIQDPSALGWQLKCQRAAKDFRVGPQGRFVSLRLARAEGRKGAAARGEGRIS